MMTMLFHQSTTTVCLLLLLLLSVILTDVVVTATAILPPEQQQQQQLHNDNNANHHHRGLKKFGGGGGGGGYKGGGGTATGAGSSFAGGRTSPTFNANSGHSYCCASQCCYSGYRRGYAYWWYRGYRASDKEDDDFQDSLRASHRAIENLLLLNFTEEILLKDCALARPIVVDTSNNDTTSTGTTINGKNDTTTVLTSASAVENMVVDEQNATLRLELRSLANRMDAIEDQFETEVDLHDDLKSWFGDFGRIEPCLDRLTQQSEEHQSRVMVATEKVNQAEARTERWERALANSGAAVATTRSWFVLTTMTCLFGLGVFLV